MSPLRATFHFAVEKLLVAPELLGRSFELARDGHRVTIVLPLRETETAFREGPVWPCKNARRKRSNVAAGESRLSAVRNACSSP